MRLLRFGLENFRSFRNSAEVSFVATHLSDDPGHVMPSEAAERGLLPVVGVYGANAAGKSNLLDGVLVFRNHVESSFGRSPSGTLRPDGWRLDDNLTTAPTVLFADFEIEGVHYQYGFAYTRGGYESEWLYRWPRRQRQILFERESYQDDDPFYFGPSLKGEKKSIADATRPNALFLSTAAQFNNSLLLKVHNAIVEGIRPAREIRLSGHPVFGESSPMLRDAYRARVVDFLEAVDIGVRGFEVEKLPDLEMPEEFAAGIEPDLREKLESQLRIHEARHALRLVRMDDDGEAWSLPAYLESAGTNALLARMEDLFDLGEAVLVADEFDASLHPDVAILLLMQFMVRETNSRGAQLLFATHSRELLDRLRRDEICLVDKDRSGVSEVRSLAEFKGIRKRDRVSTLHRNGRVGGVPIVRPPLGILT